MHLPRALPQSCQDGVNFDWQLKVSSVILASFSTSVVDRQEYYSIIDHESNKKSHDYYYYYDYYMTALTIPSI